MCGFFPDANFRTNLIDGSSHRISIAYCHNWFYSCVCYMHNEKEDLSKFFSTFK